jgi:hypothetical protein
MAGGRGGIGLADFRCKGRRRRGPRCQGARGVQELPLGGFGTMGIDRKRVDGKAPEAAAEMNGIQVRDWRAEWVDELHRVKVEWTRGLWWSGKCCGDGLTTSRGHRR